MADEDNKNTNPDPVEHPLEKLFNIEPGTTLVEPEESIVTGELVDSEMYDAKDKEVEGQFQEIYDKAVSAFDEQSTVGDFLEGKYKARNAEIAVQFLNTALAAAKEKANLKQHKDKLISNDKGGSGKTVNNNLIVTDRNEILKLLNGKDKK